jgi:hypothetical protein
MGEYRNKEKGKDRGQKFFSFQLPSSPSCPSVLSPPTPYFTPPILPSVSGNLFADAFTYFA